jgi:uncharacterized protein YkwD
MLKKALLALTIALLCTPALTLGAGSRSFYDDELRVFSLVNQERAKRGLSSIQWNAGLSDLARSFSRQMADEGFFDHYDKQGASVVDRARRARIKGWHKIGENLFYCERSPQFVGLAIRGWLRSPAHRDNMFDPSWTATGIGIARASNGQIYITEVFVAD